MPRPTLFDHPKFHRLCHLLKMPEPHVLGHLEFLWRVGYSSGNPVIGDETDIEIAAKWSGETGVLVRALEELHLIDRTDDGRLEIHDLLHHAPEYVKDRWRKEQLRKKKGRPRVSRTKSDISGTRSEKSDRVQDKPASGPTLSGTPAPAPAPSPTPAQTPSPARAPARDEKNLPATPAPLSDHHAFIRAFTGKWSEHYEGKEYHFQGAKDGTAAAEILKAIGPDPARWNEILDRYFAESTDFYRGHPLALLRSQLNRFLVPSSGNGPSPLAKRVMTEANKFVARGEPQ